MTALSGLARNAGQLTAARIGVGVGEATASPSAYSLISDWFPARLRATALAIYSSGLYLGGGISLLIGALVVENWNAAYPNGGPLNLVGWQAAFLAVGIPGLLLALWVLTLREPVRGAIDGLPTPENPRPFRGFFDELVEVIPPFTFIGAARRGGKDLLFNGLGAAFFVAATIFLSTIAPATSAIVPGISDQWLFLGVGYYAVFSWALALRTRDRPTFALTWGSPAFLTVVLGYGAVAFISYAASYWGAPYAERMLGADKSDLGWFLGGPSAVAGFVGVIVGGRIADYLLERLAAGRVVVILLGLVTAVPPIVIAYTTRDLTTFYFASFFAQMTASSALGAAAASSQALVLPRMRGMATAIFFLSTTLVGLGIGPFMAGYVSAISGDDLGYGMMTTLVVAPIGVVLLVAALRLVPRANESVIERARAAGEDISPATLH